MCNYTHLADSVVSFSLCRGLKWRRPDKELVAEDSETPDVNSLVVLLALHHLWRQVVQCATHGGPSVCQTHNKRDTNFTHGQACLANSKAL